MADNSLEVFSIVGLPIHTTVDRQQAVDYKAAAFLNDIVYSTMTYEIKRTRAVFDRNIVWPNGRRGAWRCPPGTTNGGQITDRFGRNCGWGVTRRIANAISDVGERLEDRNDRKRRGERLTRAERRARRLEARRDWRDLRMMREMEKDPERFLPEGALPKKPRSAGMLERAARRGANALDRTGRGGGRRQRGPGLLERAAGRGANALDRTNRPGGRQARGPGRIERAAGRAANALDRTGRPVAPRRRRGAQAPRRPRGIDPARPTLEPGRTFEGEGAIDPRRPTIPGGRRPAGRRPGGRRPAGRRTEGRGPEGGGRRPRGIDPARPTLEPGRTFEGEGAIDPRRPTIQPSGRGRRRTTVTERPKPSATRRPKASDEVVDEGKTPEPRPRRQVKPFKPAQKGARGFKNRDNAEDAAKRQARAEPGRGFAVVKHNDKFYVVDDNEARRLGQNPDPDVDFNGEIWEVPRGGTASNKPEKITTPVASSPRALDSPDTPKSPEPVGSPPNGTYTPPGADRDAVPGANKVRNQAKRKNGGQPDKAKIGFYDKDGNPILARIPKGANGIDTQEQATKHVADGGDLRDVPDEFLLDAIRANSSTTPGAARFVRKKTGDGVNATGHFHYKDSVTGARFGIKFENRKAAAGAYGRQENFLEALGPQVLHRLGFEHGAQRILAKPGELEGALGDKDRIPWLYEFLPLDGRLAQDGQALFGDIAAGGEVPFNADELLRGMAWNFMAMQGDRHPGNWLYVTQNGQKRLAYWDHGLGMGYQKGDLDFDTPKSILEWLADPEAGARNYEGKDRFEYRNMLRLAFGVAPVARQRNGGRKFYLRGGGSIPLDPAKRDQLRQAFDAAQKAVRDAKVAEIVDGLEPDNWPGVKVRPGAAGNRGDWKMIAARADEFASMSFDDFVNAVFD